MGYRRFSDSTYPLYAIRNFSKFLFCIGCSSEYFIESSWKFFALRAPLLIVKYIVSMVKLSQFLKVNKEELIRSFLSQIHLWMDRGFATVENSSGCKCLSAI